ncbi:MAG: UbiA family prenyltransferase, partial [Candidatus Methanospirareceae archaeon]
YIVSYVLSTSYSSFPIRLKERGIWGVVDDMLIEKTLPVFLIFSFFDHYSLETLIIVLFFSFLQLKIILDHQCWDYHSDVKSGIRTFVVERGIEKATAILDITRKIFLLLFFILAAIIVFRCLSSLIVLIPLFFGYFIVRRLVSEGKLERKNVRVDLNIPEEWLSKTPLYDGYIITAMNVISIFMAILVAIRDYHYSFLIFLVLLSQYYLIKGHYVRILRIFLR